MLTPLLLLLAQDWTRLAADEPATRETAWAELAALDRPGLLESLRKRDDRRTLAAIALGVQGEEKARDALLALTRDKGADVRAAAYEALGGLKVPNDVFLRAFLDEPRVAFAAARGLARRNPSSEKLLEITEPLFNRKPTVQNLIARLAGNVAQMVLGDSGAERWMDLLGEIGDADDMAEPAVAGAGALALRQMALPRILNAIHFGDEEPFHKACLRTDLKDDDREHLLKLWLRVGRPTDRQLGLLLASGPEAFSRRAFALLTPSEPSPLNVPRWLDWLADDAVAPRFGATLEEWVAKQTGVEPKGGRADKLAAWRDWWSKNADAVLAGGVTTAIQRGARDLRTLARDGRWRSEHGEDGPTALAIYTLLKCGADASDRAVSDGLAWLRARPVDPEPYPVYVASLNAMLFAEVGDKRRLQDAVASLLRAQNKDGGWGYGPQMPRTDTSNTQFAVLGLRAAQNAGAKIPKATWSRCTAFLRGTQLEDGEWAYLHANDQQDGGYGSMTAAGLCALLIARSSESGTPPDLLAKDKEAAAALEWLRENWDEPFLRDVKRGLGSEPYWFWTLGRACLLADVRTIGKVEWYREGAAALLSRPSWSGPYGVCDHCFALLFLTRAYVPVREPVATGDKK